MGDSGRFSPKIPMPTWSFAATSTTISAMSRCSKGCTPRANPDDVRNAMAEPLPLALFANWPSSADPPGSILGAGTGRSSITYAFLEGCWLTKAGTGSKAAPRFFRRACFATMESMGTASRFASATRSRPSVALAITFP